MNKRIWYKIPEAYMGNSKLKLFSLLKNNTKKIKLELLFNTKKSVKIRQITVENVHHFCC